MKRVVSCIIVIMLLINTTTVVYGKKEFPDVPAGAWYEAHVRAVADKNIIIGNGQGLFKPDDVMSADQFIKTMVVALGYNNIGNGSTYWASKYIDKARELKLIDEKEYLNQGIASQPISRGEMAKICERTILQLEGLTTYTKADEIKAYIPDIAAVNASGYEYYILKVYELGIITGVTGGSFMPSGTLTRAAASTVIHRIIDASVRVPFNNPVVSAIEIKEDGSLGHALYVITLDTESDLGLQYKDAKAFLTPIIGKTLSDEIIKYVMQKTEYSQGLDEVKYPYEDKLIWVESHTYSSLIDIYIYRSSDFQ